MVCTLLDRRDNFVIDEEDRTLELETITQALRTCGYPEWALNKVKYNIRRKDDLKEEKVKGEKRNRSMVVIPYVQGIHEKVSRVFKKRRVSMAVRPH